MEDWALTTLTCILGGVLAGAALVVLGVLLIALSAFVDTFREWWHSFD